MMSIEGRSDFAPQESGESRFQEQMRALGLIVHSAYPINTKLLHWNPDLNPQDTVSSRS